MPAFFLTFLAAALATIAGREAVRVARLAAAHGAIGLLLLAVVVAVAVQAMLAVGFGASIAPLLPPAARPLFAAVALALAGAEVLLLRAGPAPKEPTRSFAATLIVLLLGLLFGASGFLILAMSVATAAPILAGAGGALGTMAAMAVACGAGAEWDMMPLSWLRYAGGGILLLVALVIAAGAL